ncbi:septum site-determining protein MinC [Phototrophicus methaneseepsis]|uniref:Probable septum site-determining protein MinC n=1 Tax=Phototrophicus methaneseepsis TaxID=2710758 RepID=A0A7S8E772_9CHLR|nr:septum site-determining protein MinC [Phototrophicus methaneseepsis]QPC81626.1 septum site-determining protein MinC [Phototrophicus methaneseepsis]
MTNNDQIAIKGNKEGLLIMLSPTEEWLGITQDLAQKLDEQSSFFSGAKVTVDVGARPVPKYELSSLKALLERRGMLLSLVRSESATTLASAQALDVRTQAIDTTFMDDDTLPTRDRDDTDTGDTPIDSEEAGTQGVMVKRTLRSGRTIHSKGHVIVFGDVNPGAKIVAAGDIIIWGKLRGTVHAGAEGDDSVVICALDMNPNQLRIAGHIVTSPKDHNRQVMPEVAFVRNNQIVVEAWTT